MKKFTVEEKENFINTCKTSQSMAQACAKLGMNHNTFIRYAKKFDCYVTNQSGKGISKNEDSKIKYTVYDILNGKCPEYNTYKFKLKLYKAGIKEDKCEICGWSTKREGEKYSACELHHKDGNPHNHRLENLQILCPNCHSLTLNYRAKNKEH